MTATLADADAGTVAADVDDLLAAAVAWHLDDVELTEEQDTLVLRLFPQGDHDDRRTYLARIGGVLAAIGDDIRPHWQFEQGVDVDGRYIPEDVAVSHLDSARCYAARCIAAGGLA